MRISDAEAALLRRLRGLKKGVHRVLIVKSQAGKRGLVAWTVTEGRLEKPRSSSGRSTGEWLIDALNGED